MTRSVLFGGVCIPPLPPSNLRGRASKVTAMTFNLAAGTEICVAAIEALAPFAIGRTLREISCRTGGVSHCVLRGDSHCAGLGPEKGCCASRRCAVSMRLGPVGRVAKKPVWRLVFFSEKNLTRRSSACRLPPHPGRSSRQTRRAIFLSTAVPGRSGGTSKMQRECLAATRPRRLAWIR